MKALFHTVIYQPLFNLLVWFYNVIPGSDAGVAIILLTIVIKIILWPFSASSIKSQRALTVLQPKIEELKAKFKDDKQGLAVATMALYKENKVNPFSSCLPLLIQLPVLLGLYWVLRAGLNGQDFNVLYPFVKNPGHFDPIAFGFLDLAQPNIMLALLAGASQYVQAKMLMRKKPPVNSAGAQDERMMAMMNKQMLYFFPILTVVIGMQLPAGLTLYWFVTTVLTVVQQKLLFKRYPLPNA